MKQKIYLFMLTIFVVAFTSGCGGSTTSSTSDSAASFPQELGTSAD